MVNLESEGGGFPVVPAVCVCNRVGIVYRLINQFYARAFEGLGITNEQVSLLIMLFRRGRFLQHEVGKALGMDKSTISRNVKNLLACGWVNAVRTPGKRGVLLTLTAAGKKKVNALLPRWKAQQEAAEKLFGEAALGQLNHMIVSLKKELK